MASENQVDVVFDDYDDLLQVHDLLCDLIGHFKEGQPLTKEEMYNRVKNDIEYIAKIQKAIHESIN